jgi:hypothetical protein
MKIAIVTTTIHTPHTMRLLSKLSDDVRFFVALDENTPEEAVNFCQYDVPNTQVIFLQDQEKWACSKLIPMRCVERRNLAILEAVAWGADVLVSWDNDNVPIDAAYFSAFEMLFDPEWPAGHTLKASSPTGWFDPGCLLMPQTKHRGFPIGVKSEPVFEPVIDAKIGVAQGLCLGDPDIDAVTRIALSPTIHSVSELGRAGIVVDPACKTVYNTQNTAFIRELAPAMFQPPGVGRYSDIYASLITQRVMRERGLHVHFGQPFIWQQRNKHNLIGDLRQEINGMEHIAEFGAWLDDYNFRLVPDVVPQVRTIYDILRQNEWWPPQATKAAFAFLDDMESVL